MDPADLIRTAANINLRFLMAQLEQIDDATLAEGGGFNSPAWQTGHLLTGVAGAAKLLGQEVEVPQWVNACGRGSTPPVNRSDFPAKAEMLATAETFFARAIEGLAATTPEQLQKEMPDPNLRPLLPTVGEAVVFLLTSHAALHVGQIAAWRRARGLPQLIG